MTYKPTGQDVQVLSVHYDDIPPYYTVLIVEDGREKQTSGNRLAAKPKPEPGGAAGANDGKVGASAVFCRGMACSLQ